MHVYDVLSAILMGAIIGTLGRLVLPGKQNVGVFLTLLIGIGSAVLGTFVARWLHVPQAPQRLWLLHWDWVVLGIQVAVAVVGIALATLVTRSRLNTDVAPKKAASRRNAARKSTRKARA